MLLRAAVMAAVLTCLSAAPAAAAPTLTIDSGPEGPTSDPTPTFEFTVENHTLPPECSVDKGPEEFGPCSDMDSHTEGPLPDGNWTFRVRATDGVETTTETRSFTVDTVGPAATIEGPKKTGNRRPTFHVSSSEPATFTCKLDNRPPVTCGAGGDDPYAEAFSPRRDLKPGMHTLVVTAFDALGNRGPPEQLRFRVLRPPLKAGRAKRTVRTALRRHKFANRVLSNLEQSCSRRGRFRFSCRFSSSFPGYKLTGRGPVELQRGRISYRFRVRAQGQRVVLTDENEGRFPG